VRAARAARSYSAGSSPTRSSEQADAAREVAALLGGRPVAAVLVDDETYTATLVEHGHARAGAQADATFGIGTRRDGSDRLSSAG
jgi:hypothetical protein